MALKLIWLLMIMTASVISLSLPQTTSSDSKCNIDNAYLRKLPNGLKLENKDFSSNRCGGEWKTYGNCCNETLLVEEAIKDRNRIQSAVKRVNEEITYLRKAMKEIFELLKKVAFMPVSNNPALRIVSDIMSQAKILLDRPDVKGIMADFEEEDNNGFVLENINCWNEVIKERSGSLCDTCSGRAKMFFVNDRGVVDQGFCKKHIDGCQKSFIHLTKLINGTSFLDSFSKNIMPLGISIGVENKINPTIMTKILGILTKEKLENLLEVYAQKNDQESLVSLCSKLVNLRDESYLEFVMKTFKDQIGEWSVKSFGEGFIHFAKNMKVTSENIKKWETQVLAPFIKSRKPNMLQNPPIISSGKKLVEQIPIPPKVALPKKNPTISLTKSFGNWRPFRLRLLSTKTQENSKNNEQEKKVPENLKSDTMIYKGKEYQNTDLSMSIHPPFKNLIAIPIDTSLIFP